MLDSKTIQLLSGAKENVANVWLPYFNQYFPKYGLTTSERIASFLSQVGHESGALLYTEEIASGSAYEGRKDLGNTVAGDGVRFKGRGLIQTTGRKNYQDFKDKFGIDVINNPSLLGAKNALVATPEQLKNSLLSALEYWTKKRIYPYKDLSFSKYNSGKITPKASILNSESLNELSDKLDLSKPITDPTNSDTIKKVTQVINGGQNGIEDRLSRFEKGRNYIKDVATTTLKNINTATEVVKKNPLKTVAIAAAVTILIYTGYKLIKKNI